MNMSLEAPAWPSLKASRLKTISETFTGAQVISLGENSTKMEQDVIIWEQIKKPYCPCLKCGLVINVCVTVLSLRLFFYLILPQSVCRTLEGWQTLITLYDATNSVSVICVASKCFPRECKGIKLPLNYTTHYYMLVLLKKNQCFPLFQFSVLPQYQLDAVKIVGKWALAISKPLDNLL